MSQFRWRVLGRFVSKELLACGGLLVATCLWAAISAASCGSGLSDGEQRSLVGGNSMNESCTGTGPCVTCNRPLTCTPVTGWFSTYCDCLVWGTPGCQSMLSFDICSPAPGSNCTKGGGPPACGSYATSGVLMTWTPPVVAPPIPGFWTCTPVCTPVSGGSQYCNDCL